jgi:hypothetical protein
MSWRRGGSSRLALAAGFGFIADRNALVEPLMDAAHTAPTPRGRRIVWLNVLTVVSAAILIGAEVFGAAFAGSWAIATLFELGGWGARILDILLLALGAVVMVQFVRNARRVEPFTE